MEDGKNPRILPSPICHFPAGRPSFQRPARGCLLALTRRRGSRRNDLCHLRLVHGHAQLDALPVQQRRRKPNRHRLQRIRLHDDEAVGVVVREPLVDGRSEGEILKPPSLGRGKGKGKREKGKGERMVEMPGRAPVERGALGHRVAFMPGRVHGTSKFDIPD
jgi:hypothetical protein